MTKFQTYLYPNTVNIETCFNKDLNFSEIIDVRSPNEFNEDHIPTAKNFPVLNNLEREKVGLEYKKNRFSGKKLGASIIAKNISIFLEKDWINKDINWKPLIYCWRGGERSKSLSYILSRIGFKVYLIDGGYKSYRKFILDKISEYSPLLKLNVICGLTGSGKTRLLNELKIKGNQIIDLEKIANHCGSLLGEHPSLAQPSQKLFESLLFKEIKSMDLSKKIFIESESKKIGDRHVPDDLIIAMRKSECIWIDVPENERVNNLKKDYQHLISNQVKLKFKLENFKKFKSKSLHQDLLSHFEKMEWEKLIKTLLEKHYDPLYLESISKNYKNIKNSKKIKLKNTNDYSLLADELSNCPS